MTAKSESTVTVTPDMVRAALAEMASPEFLARLDAQTDDDIAAQIAADPDLAPELTEDWFENARLVIPLKGRAKRAA